MTLFTSKVLQVVVSVTLSLAVSGCFYSKARLSVAAVSPVNPGKAQGGEGRRIGPAEGRSCLHIAIFLPVGGPVTLEDAVEKALAASGGNVLRDVEVQRYYFYVPYVYGRNCWIVRGEAYEVHE